MPTLHVQLEERDYVNAARAAAQPSQRTVALFALASALVLVVVYLSWRAGYMRQAVIAGFAWSFGLIGGWFGHTASIATRAKRIFRQQHGLRRAHEISWNDDGLTISAEDGQSMTRWSDLHKIRELDDQFILFLSDALFLMIPKRAFPDRNLLNVFRESLAAGQNAVGRRTERSHSAPERQ